jgi:hypothetical protein
MTCPYALQDRKKEKFVTMAVVENGTSASKRSTEKPIIRWSGDFVTCISHKGAAIP